nr:hypothetical protein [Tanacetum cinerariifolium]
MGTRSVNNSRNGGNGDGDSENAWQTYPNSTSDGVVLISTPNPGKSSSYANVTRKPSRTKVNFCTLFTPTGNGIDVVVPVKNTWGKYGLVRSMFSSSIGLFSFQFSSMDGLDAMLENGMSSYARAMIELRADAKFLVNPKGVPVGQKVGFKPAKQVYQLVSKKPTANTSGNKKKNVKPTKEVKTSNSASQEANSSGSSFWNVNSISHSTTPIIEKIDKIEKLIIDEKVTFVDDEEKLLKKDVYDTNSLLEQWKESYENDDYNYDPYDDDMYEDLDKLQCICDNLDIKDSGGKKK